MRPSGRIPGSPGILQTPFRKLSRARPAARVLSVIGSQHYPFV